MKSCLFYSNMTVKVNVWFFIWLLTVKTVNGFGYVNQEEVKSQYTGCLNICVKLCKAFGETRFDLKTIFRLGSLALGPWTMVHKKLLNDPYSIDHKLWFIIQDWV